jgi:hypothetical protein
MSATAHLYSAVSVDVHASSLYPPVVDFLHFTSGLPPGNLIDAVDLSGNEMDEDKNQMPHVHIQPEKKTSDSGVMLGFAAHTLIGLAPENDRAEAPRQYPPILQIDNRFDASGRG